ncbi:hypothetical protein [Streptomyces nigrescens]|uniref:hypothetical protein n=1 Tax=Streptomyces nigrescens TaxID=1920 RepID=UPI00349460FA
MTTSRAASFIKGTEGACGQRDVALGGVGLRRVDVQLDEPTCGTADCVLQRALSPFLIAAASGLVEEPLTNESSQAGAGDVNRGLVGGQAEVFVQVTDAEYLPGMLVEGSHDALVDGG